MSAGLVLAVVGAGVLVGILSALFGVGGGLLMVPFMVIALNESQHLAEGTSLLVIVPTAVAGVVAYRKSGLVQARVAALVAVGGIAGALVGADIALGLAGEILQRAFGLFLAAMGAGLIFQGIRARKSETAEQHKR